MAFSIPQMTLLKDQNFHASFPAPRTYRLSSIRSGSCYIYKPEVDDHAPDEYHKSMMLGMLET